MQINLRRKWRRILAFGLLWAFILFPIPFLPLFGGEYNQQAVQTLIIITFVVSLPLALLVIFMK